MNIVSIYKQFPNEADCITYLERVRWQDKPICPYCNSTNSTLLPKEQRHHCNNCNTTFSVTVNTIFHQTHLPLQKWLLAVTLVLNAKKGIAARQLARDLEVNRNTAWRMGMKIRQAMIDTEQRNLLTGLVEMDETYIGGKPRRGNGREKPKRGRGTKKVPVIGITGDTKWFDDLPNLFAGVKMLIAHIGSDGKSKNHLNPKGVLKLTKNIPNLETLVITEFDYDEFGQPEKKRITETEKITQNLKANSKSVHVIPSDLGLRIDLETNKVFIKCELCHQDFLNEFVKCKRYNNKPLWIDIDKVKIEEMEDRLGRGLIYKVRENS